MKRKSAAPVAPDTKCLRLMDANLNRAREGLRVIEDTARFVLEKKALYIACRSLRHRLDAATRPIYKDLVKERDSVTDAGREIAEGGRTSIAAVLAANFRRVEEAMRVLEEYAKLIVPAAAPEFKAIRYAAYTLEKKTLE